MGSKYDMRICKCGRIHMVPSERRNKALEVNKDLLLICGECGASTLIGGQISNQIGMSQIKNVI